MNETDVDDVEIRFIFSPLIDVNFKNLLINKMAHDVKYEIFNHSIDDDDAVDVAAGIQCHSIRNSLHLHEIIREWIDLLRRHFISHRNSIPICIFMLFSSFFSRLFVIVVV